MTCQKFLLLLSFCCLFGNHVSAAECPEGKTFTGACLRAQLGADMRQHILSATQPKLSLSSPSLMPSDDAQFAMPRDATELKRYHGIGADFRYIALP